MLRPSRAGKPKPAALRNTITLGAGADGEVQVMNLASNALFGNRQNHTRRDYIWLAIVLASIAYVVIFWPVWDQLIGSEEDYFTILGVDRNADQGVVKRAYRSLARQWHPDHNPGCGEECRERMRVIQEAYTAVLNNPGASAKDDDDGGFNATILHLFLGRLFDMVFFFAEFVVCLVPTIGFTQWNGYRGIFLLGGAIVMHSYLISVRVPLSWVGIAVCLWKFQRLGEWAPAIRATQQLGYLILLVLPASLYYTFSVFWFQGAMSWYQFGLNLIAGIIYLAGFLIRSRAQIFSTYQIKRVPHLPFKLILSLLWDYACTDLLCYTIKIPNPFRVAAHILVLIVLYQRWIYVHVDKSRLNEFGRIIGVQSSEAAQYPGFEPAQPKREVDSGPPPLESSSDSGPKPQPTEAKKITKEERILRQRQERPNSNRGLVCLVIGTFLLFLLFGLAGFLYQWYDGETIQINLSSGPPPAHRDSARTEKPPSSGNTKPKPSKPSERSQGTAKGKTAQAKDKTSTASSSSGSSKTSKQTKAKSTGKP